MQHIMTHVISTGFNLLWLFFLKLNDFDNFINNNVNDNATFPISLFIFHNFR